MGRPGDGGVGQMVLECRPDAFDGVVVRAVAGAVTQVHPGVGSHPPADHAGVVDLVVVADHHHRRGGGESRGPHHRPGRQQAQPFSDRRHHRLAGRIAADDQLGPPPEGHLPHPAIQRAATDLVGPGSGAAGRPRSMAQSAEAVRRSAWSAGCRPGSPSAAGPVSTMKPSSWSGRYCIRCSRVRATMLGAGLKDQTPLRLLIHPLDCFSVGAGRRLDRVLVSISCPPSHAAP